MNKDQLCKDCKQPMVDHGASHHDKELYFPEHKDRCCDCADELMGMKPEYRKRPRPKEVE